MPRSVRIRGLAVLAAFVSAACSSPHARDAGGGRVLVAEMFDAGFYTGDSCYKGIGKFGDGRIYYQISSHRVDTHGRIFAFDPTTRKIEPVADLGEAVGEKGRKTVSQGKIHVDFIEHRGRLYTATHVGFYQTVGDVELPGKAEGYAPYPGGHFVSYDPAARRFDDLARAPAEEGIITMAMDRDRESLYGLTWPGGLFVSCDVRSRTLKSHGPVLGQGERGRGDERMVICRTLALDPRDGSVYWSDTSGIVYAYRRASDAVETIREATLNFIGRPEQWRQIVWRPKEGVFYGVTNASSTLFRFDPAARRVQARFRIPVRPQEEFSSTPGKGAALGFRLGPDGDTLYYLAVAPSLVQDGRTLRNTLRFVTYHIPSGTYRDHGTLRLRDGGYPVFAQSLEESDGMLYTVAWIEVPDDGSARTQAIRRARPGGALEEINLIRFPDPMRPARE